ncbi:squalene synthase HpnC [Nitrospirillum viridazoti]|uniref:Squalene synthase HpnC n=1 Tax=Nitrospirillum amazonense TaxID=28077 RepID=A0A560HP89_9PROT|nr:squalene synthase HpnC [Nitrospirillum amazonense]TWB47299.1 squalene synthase HpnC [Nitrospirillum amazonense]
MTAANHRTGKGHKDENFPVASLIIRRDARAPVMAYYAFARVADDVSDSPMLAPDMKLKLLDAMGASLRGERENEPEAVALREVLRERGLPDQHAHDLLTAFRRDVTQLRYTDWDDLMDYCRYSAMPVGRYVLDVHGESRDTWPASDALCAALQVINHLQDCGKDKRALDRVYIPLPLLIAGDLMPDVLLEPAAPPALLDIIHHLAKRTDALLDQAEPLAAQVKDLRLAIEVAIIQRLARRLVRLLLIRDPLSDRVHLTKMETLCTAAGAALSILWQRMTGGGPRAVPVGKKP